MPRNNNGQGSQTRRNYLRTASVSLGALMLAGCTDSATSSSSGGGGGDANNTGGESGDGASSGNPSKGNTIKLGTLAPNSGTFSSSGKYVQKGNELAAKQINKEGGINGSNVQTVTADTQTTPKAGASAATRLIQQENVDMLSGAVSSSVGLAIADVAEKNKIPYMSGIASLDFGTKACQKYVFANNPSTHMTANAYLPYFVDKGAKSFYFINADYSWGQNASQYYKKLVPELGAKFTGESFAPFGASDFASQINSAMNSGADALILTLYGQDIVKAINQLIQYNAREQFDYISTVVNSVTLDKAINELDGFYFGGKYYWEIESPPNKKFVKQFRGAYNEVPPMPAALQYGSTYEMLRAAKKAETANGDAIATKLEGWTADPYYKGGKANFRACDHRLISDIFLMKGKPKSKRKNEADLLDIIKRFNGQGLARPCSETCDGLPAWS